MTDGPMKKLATAHMLRAHEQFRRRMERLPAPCRLALTEAMRELAQAMMPLDVERALMLEEVTGFVEPALAMPSSPSLPPDHEGDEELLERRGHLRVGSK